MNVWTVNAPDDLGAMVELGVDAVITDRAGATGAGQSTRAAEHGTDATGA